MKELQEIADFLNQGLGGKVRFIRSCTALEDLRYFVKLARQSHDLVPSNPLELPEAAQPQYFELSGNAVKHLKSIFLFGEVFLNAFASDLQGKEQSLQNLR